MPDSVVSEAGDLAQLVAAAQRWRALDTDEASRAALDVLHRAVAERLGFPDRAAALS